jgi:hypothetical protein
VLGYEVLQKATMPKRQLGVLINLPEIPTASKKSYGDTSQRNKNQASYKVSF